MLWSARWFDQDNSVLKNKCPGSYVLKRQTVAFGRPKARKMMRTGIRRKTNEERKKREHSGRNTLFSSPYSYFKTQIKCCPPLETFVELLGRMSHSEHWSSPARDKVSERRLRPR